jgi:hypothetical protein
MLRRLVVGSLALLGMALLVGVVQTAAQGPGPTAGEVLATGLLSPRGMKIGPDGMIYVAEAGLGGDVPFTADGVDYMNGQTGRISKIDPETGERTTVVDELASNAGPEGDAVGPADVAFLGGQLYYLQTHGGEGYGFPDSPTGIYRVNNNGSVDLVADIGAFNLENPIADLVAGTQADIEVGGNPYAMIVRDGAFLVTDGNQNQVMKATTDGTISRIADFRGHPVATGIASNGGPLIVGGLGQFPFTPADGNVYQVGYPSGNIAEIADGYSSVTDVEFGPGGQLYALTFGDQASSPDAPAPWDFYTGKILRVDSDGTQTPVVDGLNLSAFLIFNGDTAYVSNNSVTIPGVFDGEIVKIEGFSSLAPLGPRPEPTVEGNRPPSATPTKAAGVILPPDTGEHDGAPGQPFNTMVVVIAMGIASLGAAGWAVSAARR